ncbi:MAG: tRNA (adenosine(37)-N6)-threonylcarbamoyltransferase complex transferase subunit TsaD [Oscillospiraceae bacterium]|nr:tRNA (adenosine(37)-N6)-threonylcarbamoyltransferase complex transferase subunit TsaD [Oscillospiraceae bacterium]
MKILAIESSCDETAAAIVEDGRKILTNVVSSQIDIHKQYGGVVPEIASRHHCENILPVVSQALEGYSFEDIDAIGVTYAPGLIGALLVGVSFAKGLATALSKPLIPVNHLQGHIASLYLSTDLKPPFLALIISGGHTHIVEVSDYTKYNVIGRTRDDAAGECFDKAARALGFPYPGGVYIDKAAVSGKCTYPLPKPKVEGQEFDFSFSGLKTAVLNTIHNTKQRGEEINSNDMAASLQQTISDILIDKTLKAAERYNYKTIALAGGVSANSGIRKAFENACENRFKLYLPEKKYCGDNAAMIASQAYYNFSDGIIATSDLNAYATSNI